MTDDSDKKPKDPGVYRESPPDAPPPPPVPPTEYQRQLTAEREVQQFQRQIRNPMTPAAKKNVAIAAAGGIGCFAVILWVLAAAGMVMLVLIGLIIFSCSR